MEADATSTAGVEPLVVTVAEAARILSIGRTTAYELIGSGELETIHIGRSTRVPVGALAEFVARRRGRPPGYGHEPAPPSADETT